MHRWRLKGSRLLDLLCVYAIGCQAVYMEVGLEGQGTGTEYCTLFHHQVKSGGTAVKDKLRVTSKLAGLGIPGLCTTGHGYENSCLEAIEGHHPIITGYVELIRSRLDNIGRRCEYFTVMRHPIDRLVSAFFYCPAYDPQIRPKKWCGTDAMPIEEIQQMLLEFARQEWRNQAYRQMLFGKFCEAGSFCTWHADVQPSQDLHGPGTFSLLKEAQDILGTYNAVGILEHWDLSMQLFNARVKSPVKDWEAAPSPYYIPSLTHVNPNAGNVSEARTKVSAWAHASTDIHGVVALDMLLYQYALSIFYVQTAESLGTKWP